MREAFEFTGDGGFHCRITCDEKYIWLDALPPTHKSHCAVISQDTPVVLAGIRALMAALTEARAENKRLREALEAKAAAYDEVMALAREVATKAMYDSDEKDAIKQLDAIAAQVEEK